MTSRGVYPQNALVQKLAATGNICGHVSPGGDAVCVRPPGHADAHNTRRDGTGEGWG